MNGLGKAVYTSLPKQPTQQDFKEQRDEINRLKAMQPRRNWWEPEYEPYVPLGDEPGPTVSLDSEGLAIIRTDGD